MYLEEQQLFQILSYIIIETFSQSLSWHYIFYELQKLFSIRLCSRNYMNLREWPPKVLKASEITIREWETTRDHQQTLQTPLVKS